MDQPKVNFERLAADVRDGKPGAMLELWEAVRRFVWQKALARSNKIGNRVPAEDLAQAGFLAVVDAANEYDALHKDADFLSLLEYKLKSRFAEECGIKTTKRDALQYADSLDVPAFEDDPDGATAADTIPDESAALAFMGVEYADFLTYCRGTIDAALKTITPARADAIRRHFLEGMTKKQAGEMRGNSRGTAATLENIKSGIYYLKRGRYAARLRECLEAFDDFHAYESAARYSGIESFTRSGMSATEAAALVKTDTIRSGILTSE